MCSLSASPLPTPRPKSPPSNIADVAAAWAMTAGWILIVGHVTAVVTFIPGAACAIAPIVDLSLQRRQRAFGSHLESSGASTRPRVPSR
jgi:hypothetical protein